MPCVFPVHILSVYLEVLSHPIVIASFTTQQSLLLLVELRHVFERGDRFAGTLSDRLFRDVFQSNPAKLLKVTGGTKVLLRLLADRGSFLVRSVGFLFRVVSGAMGTSLSWSRLFVPAAGSQSLLFLLSQYAGIHGQFIRATYEVGSHSQLIDFGGYYMSKALFLTCEAWHYSTVVLFFRHAGCVRGACSVCLWRDNDVGGDRKGEVIEYAEHYKLHLFSLCTHCTWKPS